MKSILNIMPESKRFTPRDVSTKPFASRAFYVMEIWKDIPDYEGIYQISNLGRVKSNQRGKCRILKNQVNGCGYNHVTLSKNGIAVHARIHVLMALMFIDSEYLKKRLTVNHKDGIKTNNHISNLEVVTMSENRIHAIKNGLGELVNGERCGSSKLKEADVLYIRSVGNSITQVRLAKLFNVSNTCIRFVLSRETWKHI